MSRYIDAEALKYYGNHIGDEYEDRFHDTQWVYRNQIDDAPTIDIVRCKECKYYQDNQEGHYPNEECPWDKGETPDADDFCSYGERREP